MEAKQKITLTTERHSFVDCVKKCYITRKGREIFVFSNKKCLVFLILMKVIKK